MVLKLYTSHAKKWASENKSKIQPIQGEEIEHTVDIKVLKQNDLQKDTENDKELKILKQVIING